MKIIDAMTQDLMDEGIITGLKSWTKGKHERTYIQVSGYDQGFAGCRNHQLYWDHESNELVNRWGKGIAPDDYHNSVSRVVDAFNLYDD